MESPARRHLDHEPPFWIQENSTYFITICTLPRGRNQLCHPDVGATALKSIRYYNEKQKWFCHVALLMPDHIHTILSFPDIASFSPVVGDWKRWMTTQHQIQWQENFFDHRVRGDESHEEKANYILNNPVRARLVEKWQDWPYVWRSKEV